MLDQMTLNDTVFDAVVEVFETMIFMDAEMRSDAQRPIEGPLLLGSITFKGCIEGCLAVCVSHSCAQRIAKNMLGMSDEETLSIEEVCDAIGEVANMVMGSIKTRLLTTYTAIEVSIPSVISGRQLKNTLGDKGINVTVNVCLDEQDTAEISFLYREAKS